MSSYETQLVKWASNHWDIAESTIHSVTLETEFDEGYACCGGTDPNCYCSFAESAKMNVKITAYGRKKNGKRGTQLRSTTLDMRYGDMAGLLKEIIEA